MGIPRKMDKEQTRRLTARFDEAMDIVANEFTALDTHQQYRNAFSRLLKWDPLGRVLMMGTDQRDLFVPALRQAIVDFVPKAGEVFDFGCGDGQTLALAADALPGGARLSFEDPNPDYVDRYRRFVESRGDLEVGVALVAGFDEMEEVALRQKIELPVEGSIALGLALHMLYFVADLERGLARMARFLAPGGVLFIVLADESDGYTGHALRAFIEACGETGANAHHLGSIVERRRSRQRGYPARQPAACPSRARPPHQRPAPAEPPLWSFTLRHDRAVYDRHPGHRRRHPEVRDGTRSSRRPARARRSAHRGRRAARRYAQRGAAAIRGSR